VSDTERITVGETADGESFSLPVIDVLTGRGFATGKSGAGKSNTVSVVIEELLEAGFPTMIVDTDGEYYGLKEEYELLHAGADEECDVQIEPEHAERMATLALEENVPIILDVSGYLDADAASDLIRETARHLFAKEKKLKKPFLLVVEEIHEYVPEGGGLDDTGRMLIQIGKRGRKHGLGIVGISQRPADVKKDFITQANWLVWHRLTWENDTKVVGRILGDEYEDRISDLPNGRAFVQTDWTEADVQEVQFREKRTFDAGATPGLEDFERPDLKSVSDDLVADLEEISDRKDDERERIASLERELQEREARIEELEAELSSARDVSEAARQMAAALTGDVDLDRSAMEERVMEKDREISELRGQVSDLEAERDRLERRVETLESELDRPGETELDTFAEYEQRIEELEAELRDREQRIADLEAELEAREADLADAETAVRERESEIERLRERLAEARESGGSADPPAPDAGDAATATADDAAGRSAGDDAETDAARSDDGESTATGESPTSGDDATASDEGTASDDTPPTQTAPGEPVEVETAPDDDAVLLEDGDDPAAGDAAATAADADEGGGGDGVDPTDDAEILTDREPGTDADQETVAAAVEEVDEEDEDPDEGVELLEDEPTATPPAPDDATLVDLVLADPVTERILMAYREARCNERHTWQVVSALATAAPLSVADLLPHTDAGESNVRDLLTELRRLSLVERNDDATYELDRETIERLVENPARVDGFDDPEYVQRLD
jgi:predicted  nucleic acid-binding Zn-ribbon protein